MFLTPQNITLLTRVLELDMPWQVLVRSIDRDSGTDWTLAKDTMAFVPFLVREGIFTGKSLPIDSSEAAIRRKIIEARADLVHQNNLKH